MKNERDYNKYWLFFFSCINNPAASTDRQPPPSSLISTSALIIAEKWLIIASIALYLDSHRVILHHFNVEDLTKKKNKKK